MARSVAGLELCGLTAAFVCGCAGRHVWVEETVDPPFSHSFIRTVAVVEFENRTHDRAAGRDAADAVESLLVDESGYEVLSRMDLEWIMREHDLQVRSPVDAETMKRLGKIAGADALVLGTVDEYEVRTRRLKPLKVAREARVCLRIKLVNAATGQVVWSKRAAGAFLWRGWTDSPSAAGGSECLHRALAEAVAEAREVFPRTRRVRVPAGGSP